MNSAAIVADSREIVVDEVFPHTPEMVWKTLTTPALMGRWLMKPIGFEPTKGARFTYQTTPAGEWDGVIQCEVLEVTPNERLVYTWKGGHAANAGYGSRLETVVTWTLTTVSGGTRLRLVHSGFQTPKNDHALRKMSEGWPKVLQKIDAITGENGAAPAEASNG
ncbi:SRPBCC family protein [Sorangium sp. So ce204]|uniref:SRPBCC family protein n=1 Tax=Sorangium sp. So ce204 TaxID=3133288 RepID=UPI003F643979